MIDPELLTHLAEGRRIALISGTNGKTTTTRLTTAALGVLGEVATNSLGANMPSGHTSALAKAGDTPLAVLEVDEHYLPQVLTATRPEVVALLNLSRDQLDRAKEVAMMAQLWRDALRAHPVHVVANADDPMVVWAAQVSPEVTWVACGQRWHDDSWVCPECGGSIARAGEAGEPGLESGGGSPSSQWRCTGCALRRPDPEWTIDGGLVVDPDGARHEVKLRLPGRVNLANAATALAVAARFGVATLDALPRLTEVTSIAGRYAQVVRDGRAIRQSWTSRPKPAPSLCCASSSVRSPTRMSTGRSGRRMRAATIWWNGTTGSRSSTRKNWRWWWPRSSPVFETVPTKSSGFPEPQERRPALSVLANEKGPPYGGPSFSVYRATAYWAGAGWVVPLSAGGLAGAVELSAGGVAGAGSAGAGAVELSAGGVAGAGAGAGAVSLAAGGSAGAGGPLRPKT